MAIMLTKHARYTPLQFAWGSSSPNRRANNRITGVLTARYVYLSLIRRIVINIYDTIENGARAGPPLPPPRPRPISSAICIHTRPVHAYPKCGPGSSFLYDRRILFLDARSREGASQVDESANSLNDPIRSVKFTPSDIHEINMREQGRGRGGEEGKRGETEMDLRVVRIRRAGLIDESGG